MWHHAFCAVWDGLSGWAHIPCWAWGKAPHPMYSVPLHCPFSALQYGPEDKTNPPCIKLLFLEGLGVVFFLLCPFLSISPLTDSRFTAGIRELHLVQTVSVHKSILFHEDLLAWSLCPHLYELLMRFMHPKNIS